MTAEDGLIQFGRIVGSNAIDEILHMLGLAIACLLARVDHLVGRVENLVGPVGLDFHITLRSVKRNERPEGMLRTRNALIRDLFATLKLPRHIVRVRCLLVVLIAIATTVGNGPNWEVGLQPPAAKIETMHTVVS